jgi:hypothetical protein
MDRAAIEDFLTAVERHIVEAQCEVAKQREHVTRWERDGYDITESNWLLALWEENLDRHFANRAWLRRELGLSG